MRRHGRNTWTSTVAIIALALGSAAIAEPASADPPATGSPAVHGTVVAWGGGSSAAALTPPAGLDDVVDVAASDVYDNPYDLAVSADGSVVGWGGAVHGEDRPPAGLDHVVDVETGAGFALALRDDGTVAAWGANTTGAVDVPAGLHAIAIAAGGYRGVSGSECGYALAVTTERTVVRWGAVGPNLGCYGDLGPALDPPAGLTDVVAVAAGERHALALRADGTVVGWGSDVVGQATPPPGLTGVVAISAGQDHSVAVKSDGSVVGWGVWGESGPPRAADIATTSSATGSDVFLRRDGSIAIYRGFGDFGTPPAGSDFVAVSAGDGHGLAIEAAPTDPALVGSSAVQPRVDANPAGTAEAFRSTAASSGAASVVRLYLDQSSTAREVIVGVYADAGRKPGRLLATGRTAAPAAGDWNAIGVDPVQVVAGQPYWLAVLTPAKSGMVRFRDLPDGAGGPTQTSAQTSLSSKAGLPPAWRSGTDFANAPASIYLATR
ncbi:RCC1 domain-containing protein [Microlunatus ginsengisoli]|uniref:Alpha-tubulin suppressor n=1 Tax=Microlunatus ginsengisoli TaxID=363863 RepID=A0ABP6ZMG0_9ACTN